MTRTLALTAAAAVMVAVVAIAPLRSRVLQGAGGLLMYADAVANADAGVMTEFGEGSELELADLFQAGRIKQVVVLAPSPTPVDLEYRRRGVRRDDVVLSTLRQLGVPPGLTTTVDAGEGGTNESVAALQTWVRAHPVRTLVVVSPSHARRYRRTVLRGWPAGVPAPLVTYPKRNAFRPVDWWESRRTLREGLFELEKLAWDCVSHPF